MNDQLKFATKSLLIFALLVSATISVVAGTSVKTFDFGAGGDNPTFRSHSRSFALPENVAVVVAVNYRTTGETEFPIVVEIEDTAGQTVNSREVSAGKIMQRLIINITAADNKIHGCEKAWQVRIAAKSGEIPKARIFGDITFSFIDPAAITVEMREKSVSLSKGERTIQNVGGTNYFDHPGVLTIRASWLHSWINLVLPLKFELLRPDGSNAKTLIGYAVNSKGRPRLDFSHTLTVAEAKQNGAWKLRISNETEHDIIEINPAVSFTKRCFE